MIIRKNSLIHNKNYKNNKKMDIQIIIIIKIHQEKEIQNQKLIELNKIEFFF